MKTPSKNVDRQLDRQAAFFYSLQTTTQHRRSAHGLTPLLSAPMGAEGCADQKENGCPVFDRR
jgi:hypothetical protein